MEGFPHILLTVECLDDEMPAEHLFNLSVERAQTHLLLAEKRSSRLRQKTGHFKTGKGRGDHADGEYPVGHKHHHQTTGHSRHCRHDIGNVVHQHGIDLIDIIGDPA